MKVKNTPKQICFSRKIVHVTQYFHPSKGYQESSLAIEQIKLGFQVTIICSDDLTLWASDNNEKKKILTQDYEFEGKTGIKIIRLRKLFEISGRIFTLGIGKSINDENPNIIFFHDVYTPYTILGLLSISKKKAKNIEVIIDDHMVPAGSFNKYSSILYTIFRPILSVVLKLSNAKINKWVAVSSETKVFMLKNYGLKEKIEVLPLGYNANTCFYDTEGAEEWRINNKLPSHYKYILYIGKCDRYKNPIDLILPFSQFVKKNSDFALLIVGEMSNEYKNSFEKILKSLEIDESVFFRPPVINSEIRKVFSLAYMAIWPHGSSMAMLEAMVCNCPVIAPEINVNIERLGNLRGLLFNNSDNKLVNQMLLLPEYRDEIILNASKWVSKYTWENINNEFLKEVITA